MQGLGLVAVQVSHSLSERLTTVDQQLRTLRDQLAEVGWQLDMPSEDPLQSNERLIDAIDLAIYLIGVRLGDNEGYEFTIEMMAKFHRMLEA
jgi:hypothetical protein